MDKRNHYQNIIKKNLTEYAEISSQMPDYDIEKYLYLMMTEAGIATELMRLGIPSSEIVLAFQPPEVRQFTEFAIT